MMVVEESDYLYAEAFQMKFLFLWISRKFGSFGELFHLLRLMGYGAYCWIRDFFLVFCGEICD
jgi:hypothetical protein